MRLSTVVTGALVAGFLAAPVADAAQRVPGGAAEAKGAQIAADRAAKAGIKWQDCPADWALEKPIECGYVTVPVDYAKPNGRKIKIAVDRARSTGTAAERQGALVYNPGGPGGSGMRFPKRITTKSPLWTKTSKAYDFVGFDPRGVGHSAPPSPASTRRSSSRPPRPTRCRAARPTSAPSASSPRSTPTAAPSAAATSCRT
ncbi:hypothetical protein GCM10020000_08680 [Streptomyces olivoverticillatus]